MKNKENTQNVIVELNFDRLNEIIRQEDPNGELLGQHGYITRDTTYLDDEILLHRFGYLKGTMEALDLLGKILKYIDDCLDFTYYYEVGLEDLIVPCNGWCDGGNSFDLDYKGILDFLNEFLPNNNGNEELATHINNEIYNCKCKEISVEIYKMRKYYKEYYTRLFDRGRTVK